MTMSSPTARALPDFSTDFAAFRQISESLFLIFNKLIKIFGHRSPLFRTASPENVSNDCPLTPTEQSP